MNEFARCLASMCDDSPGNWRFGDWRFVTGVQDPDGLWQLACQEAARLRQRTNGAQAAVAALRRFAQNWRRRRAAAPAADLTGYRRALDLLDALAEGFAQAVQPTRGWQPGLGDLARPPVAAEWRDAFHFFRLLITPDPDPSAWAPFVVVAKNKEGETIGATLLALEFHFVPTPAGDAHLHPLAELAQRPGDIDAVFRQSIEQAWRLASRPKGFVPRTPLGLWWWVRIPAGHDLRSEPVAAQLSGPSAGGAAYRALVGAWQKKEPSLPLSAVADAESVCIMAKLVESELGGADFVPDAVQDIAVKSRALADEIHRRRNRPPGAGGGGSPDRVVRLDTIAVAGLKPEDRAAINLHIGQRGLEKVLRVVDIGTGY